jgi:hypothetical protein
MSKLLTTPNVSHADDIYERLIELHAGKSDEESAVINARLLLLLINHVGDRDVIFEAIALAAERPGRSAQD